MNERIKATSFGKTNKKLQIERNELSFDLNQIPLNEVTGFKYGVDPIQLDMFTVGKKYIIELKSDHVRIVLCFKSYLGISEKYFNNLYNSVLKEVWEPVVVRIINETIDDIIQGKWVCIGPCRLSKEGVLYKNFLIIWKDLKYYKRYDRLNINSISNHKVWTNLYFTTEYNVDVLMYILDWVFCHGGLEELTNNTSTIGGRSNSPE